MKTIAELGIKQTVQMLLPHLVAAGTLAHKIQQVLQSGRVVNAEHKEGHRFGSILTDADILVESYIGTQIFTTLNDVSFFGEEYEKDRISPYFPKDMPYTITLDPINGTLFFKDGLPIFDIILTIWHENKMVAAVDYLPLEGRFYIGIEGHGAFTIMRSMVDRDRAWDWEPFRITRTPRQSILTQRGTPMMVEKLIAAGFRVVKLEEEYDANPDWEIATKSLLDGGVVGIVKEAAHFIDWGAIGFIASLAGGVYNHPDYDLKTRQRAPLVAAASPMLYAAITAALR